MKGSNKLRAFILISVMALFCGSSLFMLPSFAETDTVAVQEEAENTEETTAEMPEETAPPQQSEVTQATQGLQGAEVQPTEETLPAEEPMEEDALKQRDIKAEVVNESLYKDKEKEHPTEAYKKVIRFWKALTGRRAAAGEDEMNLKVTVSGKLPEGVTAQARLIPLEDKAVFTEQGLFSFALLLFDENGSPYIPADPVKVTVQGKALKQEISEDNALLLYVWIQAPERAEKYAEKYDRAIYAADVEVYKSKSVRDKYLNYEVYDKNKEYRDGEDAVRYTEDKDGLRCDSDSAAFAYDYSAFAGRAETDQTGGIRLLLSAQTVICGSKVDRTEPGIPRYTGEGGYLFRNWRTERHDANGAENDNGIFDFSRSVTQGGPIDLYACWSSPDTVKVRILDASAKDIVLYGSTEISVPVGTREVAVNEELLGDSKPPASYSYAFAAPCSASGNLNSISADDTVTALYFNTAEQKVFVKYADGRADAPLADGSDICLVYYQKKALDIHVALVGDDGIRVDDTRRADNHQVNLSPGERVNMLTALPAGDLFAGDHEKYGFGAIAYGTHNDDGDVDVQGLGVSAISCEQADGNIYDLLLKDDQGNTITRLDAGQELYYLYYPMPKIRYVKKADNGDLISITGSIYNSAEVLVPYDDVTYNHDTFVLNGVEVKQNQNVQIPLEGLVISNASGSKSFKMPSVLDDGMFERYLKYSEIGIRNDADGHAASTADFDDAHNGHLNDRMVLYLQIRDNRLKWSFDGDSWDNMSGAPTIYAIYTDRGYELQVSKAVDTSAFSGDDSVDRSIFTEKEFTVTVSSAQITKPEYEIEGADASEVQVNSGSIVLTVRDGSRIKIKGLRQGTDYRITESGKENYLLTAKTGPINGTASEEYTPGETFALDSGRQVALTNTPKPLCQITYNDTDHIFYTLQSAVSYVNRNIPSRKADVEMLTDYLMPEKDTMTIPVGFAIKLTTAREYNGAGGNTAIITRSDAVSRSAMLDNKGTLTLEQVVIDGANSKADEAMIHSTGSLTVTGGSILQNGERAEEGTGGAIYATGDSLTINGGAKLRGNRAANGGAVYYAGSGTVTVDGGETVLTDNHATEGGHGGAIYAAGGSVELTGGMFNSNTAEGHGGAVYSAAALISVKGGLLDRNSAASGGAIYADAGTITVSGDTAVISGNTAGGRGGAIGTSSGTVEISKGRLTGNRAPNGFGGAVYADSGTVRVSGGVIGRETESSSDTETNTAKNGAAVYINTGKGYFSGGNIVRNTASEGGAVGVGGESAGLYFSGKINIRDNKQGTGESAFESSVYLDQDTDAVINANGLDAQSSEKPYIGIHVPNDVFDSRGGVGAKFGSYTLDGDAAASRLTAFHNDREPNLGAVANTGLKKLYWGKPITVQVRYLGSYAQGFPDGLNGTILQGNPYTYYPTGGDVAMSTIADDLRKNYNLKLSTRTAVYAAAFKQSTTENDYSHYLTRLKWMGGKWKVQKRDGSDPEDLGNGTLIIYFSEPAYLSIENNTGAELDLGSITVLGHSAVNKPGTPDQGGVAGYGLVFAWKGEIQEELNPVTEDKMTLQSGEPISILFPGGQSQAFSLSGAFGSTSSNTVRLRMNGTEIAGGQKLNEPISLNGTTRSDTGTYEIIFGEDKCICRIVGRAGLITNAAGGEVSRAEVNSDGDTEYLFTTLNRAVNFAVANGVNGLNDPTVEMLEDYLMPRTDVVEIDGTQSRFDSLHSITFTTAKGGKNKYSGSGNATISRGNGNTAKPMFYVSGTKTASKMVSLHDLNFDGKSLTGACDGGALKTKNCAVDIRDAHLTGFISNNGGAVFASVGDESGNVYTFNDYENSVINTATVSITRAVFTNCHSVAEGNRRGGGGVWANTRELRLNECSFTGCTAVDQGGAVFHRIESQGNYSYPFCRDSRTFVEDRCTFTGCQANAAGGVETDAHHVTVRTATFTQCIAKARGGGGLNIYIHDSADSQIAGTEVLVEGCVFSGCTAYRDGGGLNSAAQTTRVNNSTFYNCKVSGNPSGREENCGGGIYFKNRNGVYAEALGCTIDTCSTSGRNPNGGGIACKAKELFVGDYRDDHVNNGNPVHTVITNCSSPMSGGGIYHNGGTFTSITNAQISGCTAMQYGGGIYTKTNRTELIGATISGCTATLGGGGANISYDSVGSVLLDGTVIQGNISDKGGGIAIKKSVLTMRNNSRVIENHLSGNEVANAAGVYMQMNDSGYRLIIGADEVSENSTPTESETINIRDNTTKNGVDSNLRMPETGSGVNQKCVKINTKKVIGKIGVVNANKVGTQFGVAVVVNSTPTGGFSDSDAVFRADKGTLRGIIDRQDSSHTRIIWAGPPACKITDEYGNLLYFKSDGTYEAIFDVLDDGSTAGSRTSAFSTLRNPNPPKLYDKPAEEGEPGEEYKGNVFAVKMLVERYESTNPITTSNTAGRTIILTTAGSDDEDYPYEGAAGGTATIVRAGENNTGSMIVASANMEIGNIVLDGGDVTATGNGGIIRTAGDKNITVKVQAGAMLQNASASNGGAVAVDNGSLEINGGTIRFCHASDTGGAVYMNSAGKVLKLVGGVISQCYSANQGGGVCLNSGTLSMSGGRIEQCGTSPEGTVSTREGGGVFVANGSTMKTTMNMSGGVIDENFASDKGGGIAFEGENTQIFFWNKPTVFANYRTYGGKPTLCNVELDVDSNEIINVKDEGNKKGLFNGASIGVFVPGEDFPDTQYDKHGSFEKPFGSFAPNTNTSTFDGFINDRNRLKGGVLPRYPGRICWIRIFSLEINKSVLTSDNAPDNRFTDPSVNNEGFHFTVTLWDDKNTDIKVKDVADDIARAEAEHEDSKYGNLPFRVSSQGNDRIVAQITLNKDNNWNVVVQNLPKGMGYSVEETLTTAQKKKYVALPPQTESAEAVRSSSLAAGTSKMSGEIGEHTDTADTAVDPYTSTANFTNMLPVCRICDASGNILYRSNLENDGRVNNIPAVYTELSDAVAALSGPLFVGEANGSGTYASEDYQIEMLVNEYELTYADTAQLKTIAIGGNNKVTLKTASRNASILGYHGTNPVSRIWRTYNGLSMFTVTNGAQLFLFDINLDGYKGRYDAWSDGGIVHVNNGGKLFVHSGTVMQNSRVGYNNGTPCQGGAVYVAAGGEATMDGGTIWNNESRGNGAGIYLAEGSALYLSGSPTFGGTSVNSNVGNYKMGSVSGWNGGETYTRARQDIFIAGYSSGNEEAVNANSLVITGDISAPAGSIWVWAEKYPHYASLRQFAKIQNGKTVSSATLKVFRNARMDTDTGADEVGRYLDGIMRKGDKRNVCWYGVEGKYRVILRKVNSAYVPKKETFKVCLTGKTEAVDEELDDLQSGDSGIIWIGELPCGVYDVIETSTNPDRVFTIEVKDDGVYNDNGKKTRKIHH